MTTVLAIYNSDGCVGRCDAKCHEASTSECDCICGGRNHGKGTERAIRITQDLVDPLGELRRSFARTHGYDPEGLQLEVGAPRLFT